MADTLKKNDKRTKYCGEFREEDIGSNVCVMGWTQRTRNLGSLLFIDLRDRSGIVQLAFDENTKKDIFEKAETVRSEYVLVAKGSVRMRSSINETIPTGKIEIAVNELSILSVAETTPFEISDNVTVRDELSLKYRYLDLRRQSLTQNMLMRHEIAKAARDYYFANGFIEIETPMMIKSTPEGARDYLIPSRIHKGSFYALPQSPQIYKQLLMVAGFDRYIQLARCFRDEDLRADRQPEFTQIDLEMSFVDQDDIMEINEGFIAYLFKKVLDINIPTPLPRLTYADAMNRFGSDKPDTRFGMEIIDISDAVSSSDFSVFKNAIEAKGSVRAIVAENAASILSRKEIDKLAEHAKGIGAKGLAYIRWNDEQPNCSFMKFINEDILNAIITKTSAKKGDVILIVADKDKVVLPTLGALRLKIAKQLNIIPEKWNFLWITEFPFFEWNDETQGWDAMHHPFTMPLDEDIDKLDSDKGAVRAKAYDLVLNGIELSSGSIRITDPELQQRMFKLLGLTEEEIEAKFGFLVDAYNYGAPPHGGAAIGLDRLAMLMCGAGSLRDVVAFPKVQNASELMSGAPTPTDVKALNDLGLAVVSKNE